MRFFINPAKALFLIYFMMNSMVFLGQDLTVRKDTNSAWCITLAEHCQSVGYQSGNAAAALDLSRQNCTHRHQGQEVHVCIDHHKFLLSLKNPGLPDRGSLNSFVLVDSGLRRLVLPDPRLFPATIQGHDPGPVLASVSALSSILLL